MSSENKNFYLLLIILVVLGGFIYYSYKTKDQQSFHDVMKEANSRLDSINAEIVRSKVLISETNHRLDSIQQDMGHVKDLQAESNQHVTANDQELKAKIQQQELQLTTLKSQYNKVKKDRDKISMKMDSLADVIEKSN